MTSPAKISDRGKENVLLILAALSMVAMFLSVTGCAAPAPASDGTQQPTATATARLLPTATGGQYTPEDDGAIKGPGPGELLNDGDDVYGSLAVSPSDPDILYLGSEGNGIFKSIDGGSTWQWSRKGLKYIDQFPAYPEVYDIAIDPGNELIVYAATTHGPSLPNKTGPGGPAGFLGRLAGIYCSSDGGTIWSQKTSGLDNTAMDSIAINPENNRTIYAAADGGHVEGAGEDEGFGGMCRSTDGGATWKLLSLPDNANRNRFVDIVIRGPAMFTAGTAFHKALTPEGRRISFDAGNSTGLLKSTDGGATWALINPAGTKIEVFDVSRDGRIIYGASNMHEGDKHLYVSTDGGASWSDTGNAMCWGPIRILTPDAKAVVFCGGRDIYYSSDGLATSSRAFTADGNIHSLEIAPSDHDIIYAAASGLTIYRSDDGGRTFRKVADLRALVNGWQ